MPKQKSKPRVPGFSPVAAARPKGYAEARLLPFLDRHSLLLALLAVATAVARIASTYTAMSVTVDEPGHFACGLQYLARHIYTYESQHPPLARAMTALPPYLSGVRPLGDPRPDIEGMRLLGKWGPDRLLTLMRLGILPFFVLACVVVYVWARHYFGGAAAFFAVAFFTLLPQVLADAGLATTDMALAACLGAAFLALILWAESPTWKRSVLLGLASASAALAKFTALGFFPAATALALTGYLAIRRPGLRKLWQLLRVRLLPFALAVAVGALAVWAAYWFSFGEVPGWNTSLPAPEFFDGINVAMKHSSAGHLAYLLRRFSIVGWWYYFPVALAVKTPIVLLLLTAAGTCLIWKRRWRNAYLPIALFLGILLPSMASHVNIGIRHILPVYLAFAILAAIAMVQLLRWAGTRAAAALAVALPLLWMAVAGGRAHPNYLAYFNAFAGGKPEDILLDSNFDWGQGWKLLARRLRELNVREVHGYGLEAGGEYPTFRAWYGLPDYQPLNASQPETPDPGWTVVRIYADKYRPQSAVITTANGLRFVEPWYHRVVPTERVAGFLLYKVTPGFVPGS